MPVAMQMYLKKEKKRGVKDGQVSQQLKQCVHRCPPLRYIKKERKNKDSPCFPVKSSNEGVIFKSKSRIKISH